MSPAVMSEDIEQQASAPEATAEAPGQTPAEAPDPPEEVAAESGETTEELAVAPLRPQRPAHIDFLKEELDRLQNGDKNTKLGPLRNMKHLEAINSRDINALKAQDAQFANEHPKDDVDFLQRSHGIPRFELGVAINDATGISDGKAALDLYCESLAAFDPGPKVQRLAFQAVARDDVETLEDLLSWSGVSKDTKNSGGQTLLEVAIERKSCYRIQELLQ